jgi:hypothetical protein
MNLRSSIAVTAAMLVAHPTAAQVHRFEADPVASVRENFVASRYSRNYGASWTTRVFCLLANANP